MGGSGWRACAAVVLALFVGCVAPHDREIVRPRPQPVEPGQPLPALEYDFYVTPRGTDVEAPGYIANREDLFLLAMQEIDNLNFHLEFPRWTIKIVPPGDSESINAAEQRIVVAWRPDGHEPHDQMLPGLKSLMDRAFGE